MTEQNGPEIKQVILTDELVDKAFEADPTLKESINPQVVKMFKSPFIRTESGGWKGEGGNYGSTTALGRVLEFVSKPPIIEDLTTQ